MEERIDSLGKAVMLSILDANGDYFLVEIEKTNFDKIAFTSHCGLYRFVQVTVWLKNVPGMF